MFRALLDPSEEMQNIGDDEDLEEIGAIPEMPGFDAMAECFNNPKVRRQAVKWRRFLMPKGVSDIEQVHSPSSALFSELNSVMAASTTQSAYILERVATLKANVAKEGLVPHDVFPDGNCLFAAVVDQFRVRGNFVYSANSLRRKVVEYLRNHPTQDDGTHLSEFLVDEDWAGYLNRMSEDGEPADDILVRALVEVIKKPMVIFEGVSGQNRTELRPGRHQDEGGQTSTQKDGSSKPTETPPDNLLSESSLNYANQFVSKDDTKNSEDIKDIGNDVGDSGDDAKQEDCVYVGHVTEAHYVSLRKSDWETKLYQDLLQWSNMPKSCQSDHHLNFMLRYVRYSDVIEQVDKREQRESNVTIDDMYTIEKQIMTVDLTGPITEGFLCSMKRCEASFLNTDDQSEDCSKGAMEGQSRSVAQLNTPHDTVVLKSGSRRQRLPPDLIADDSACPVGYVRLRPVNAEKWSIALATNKGEAGYLRHLEINLQKNMGAVLMECMNVSDAVQYKANISFKCQWPNVASEWLTRDRPSKWPPEEVIENMMKNGCKVIPECHPFSKFPNTEWKYSFDVADRVLARKHITESQRYCFWVLRMLLREFGGHHELSHDHVKAVFFYTCESTPVSEWDRCPGSCLHTMMRKLLQCLSAKHMPSYFMKKFNMLEDVPHREIAAIRNTVKMLMHNLPMTVYFLLDKYGHMKSNIGLMMDSIFEDMNEPHAENTQACLQSVFTLETVQLIQACLLKDDLKTAKAVFIGEIGRFDDGKQIESTPVGIFQTIVKCSGIITAWCFAFSLIESCGTVFVDLLNEGRSTVPISTIFGEEFLNCVPFQDIHVPEMCVDEATGRVINFVLKSTTVLFDFHLCEAVFSGLRYFLGTYAHIVEEIASTVGMSDGRAVSRRQEDVRSKIMSSYVSSLHMIYTDLYSASRTLGKLNAFREYMEMYERLSHYAKSSDLFNCVANMWEHFGCHDRAEAARQKGQELQPTGRRYTLLVLR